MFFLNLTAAEFLAILGTVASVVVALYLLDRKRKHHVVPSLRFFALAENPTSLKHRRKLRQPWSLLLQLASLLLLLLAIAQLRLGSPDRASRDHVLILDTSAWMSARSGQGRLIDQARLNAKRWLRLLPSSDRVMVVRADALATPATLFESDREKLRQAIDQSHPGAATLNIEQALAFAQQAQKLRAQRAGEIVFVGAGRVPGDIPPALNVPANLRVIPIAGPTEHSGLRKVNVRRSPTDPGLWEIFVAAKNYGASPRSVPVVVQFGGATVGSRRFDLKPGAEESAAFEYRTRAAGWLEAKVLAVDGFNADDRALLELPASSVLPVTVYTADPSLLRPVFNAIPGVTAKFLPVSAYDPALKEGIVLLDRLAPPSPPKIESIWIEPPSRNSPVPVLQTQSKVKLNRWRSDHALAAGLRAHDVELDSAETFRAEPDDIVIAEAGGQPVIVARPAKQHGANLVVFGFHPLRSAMKYELTTPLLFANILRWMAPNIFRSWELTAGTVGTVDVDLESEMDPAAIKVAADGGSNLPFTVEGKKLRFFTPNPGIVRVLTGDREIVCSLTLPQPGDVLWQPARAKQGLPGRPSPEPASRDLWPWLAAAGALGLLADWLLFGRRGVARISSSQPAGRKLWRKAS